LLDFKFQKLRLSLQNLRHLRLKRIGFHPNGSTSTVQLDFPLLEVLEFPLTTDTTFTSAFVNALPTLEHLKYINARQATVDDTHLAKLIYKTKNLEVIDTYYNDEVGDLTMEALSKACAHSLRLGLFFGDSGSAYSWDGFLLLLKCTKLTVRFFFRAIETI